MTDERIKTLREEIKKGEKLNATYLTKGEREEIWEYENCKLSSWFDELRYKINKISL